MLKVAGTNLFACNLTCELDCELACGFSILASYRVPAHTRSNSTLVLIPFSQWTLPPSHSIVVWCLLDFSHAHQCIFLFMPSDVSTQIA